MKQIFKLLRLVGLLLRLVVRKFNCSGHLGVTVRSFVLHGNTKKKLTNRLEVEAVVRQQPLDASVLRWTGVTTQSLGDGSG